MRRGVVCATVVGLAVLMAAPAHAHAGIDHTAPRDGSVMTKAPSVITVTFDEAVDLDEAWLTGPSGAKVSSTARVSGASVIITPSATLPTGPCAASWRVTSDDGHQVTGTLAFVVGHAPATGPSQGLALSPPLSARLSGSSPGVLTLTLDPSVSSGEIMWTSGTVTEPITWRVTRQAGRTVATGVLPVSGAWSLRAALIRRDGSVLVTSGTATLRPR